MDKSVESFLNKLSLGDQKQDSAELVKIMHEVTGEDAYMYGSSIIGFGSYHYKYESGREGDSIVVGFSPRKQSLVIYGIMPQENADQILKNLGKITMGKGCIYLKRLADIDKDVLKQMIKAAYDNKK